MKRSGDTNMSDVEQRERRKCRRVEPYKNSTTLDEIVEKTCPMQLQEAHNEKVAEVSVYLRTLGITAVDVIRYELQNESRELSNMKAKKWFHEEGSVELLEICGEGCN